MNCGLSFEHKLVEVIVHVVERTLANPPLGLLGECDITFSGDFTKALQVCGQDVRVSRNNAEVPAANAISSSMAEK